MAGLEILRRANLNPFRRKEGIKEGREEGKEGGREGGRKGEREWGRRGERKKKRLAPVPTQWYLAKRQRYLLKFGLCVQ